MVPAALRAPVLLAAAVRLKFDLVDVNGDGRLDIVSAAEQGPTGVVVLLNLCGQPAGDLVADGHRYAGSRRRRRNADLLGDGHERGAYGAPNATYTMSCRRVHGHGVTRAPGTCTIAGRLVSCSLGAARAGRERGRVDVALTPIGGATLRRQRPSAPDSNDTRSGEQLGGD